VDAYDKWWLVGLTLAGTLAAGWLGNRSSNASAWLNYQIQFCAISFAMAALVISIVFRLTTNPQQRLRVALLVMVGLSSYFYFFHTRNYHLFFAILIPTLIHVFVFSALFMLAGALKHRSLLGLISVVMFLAGGIILLFTRGQPDYRLSSTLGVAYRDIFGFLENYLTGLLANQSRFASQQDLVFQEPIARFLAFTYSYHYLNWFSKTSIIQWHRVSLRTALIITVVWLSAVVVYLMDRQVGLLVVGFLSLLHVFLEFPLNWATIAAIHGEVLAVWRNGWAKTEDSCGSSTRLTNRMPKTSAERVLVPFEK
jgi:hypothetical protein